MPSLQNFRELLYDAGLLQVECNSCRPVNGKYLAAYYAYTCHNVSISSNWFLHKFFGDKDRWKQEAQLPLKNRASDMHFVVARLLSTAVITENYVRHV